MKRAFDPVWLGRADYTATLQLQRFYMEHCIAGVRTDTLLLLEHPSVITLGRGARQEHLLASPDELSSRGISIVDTERGGDVTFHGPGQLVAYPIFTLSPDRKDVRRYVRDLVRVMSLLCADYGVAAGPRDDLIGAWVDLDEPSRWESASAARRPAKIGAVGVKISRWVTMHGFALNASIDLADFALIVPCGTSAYPVTSLAALGVSPVPSVAELAERAVVHFCTVFDAEVYEPDYEKMIEEEDL